MYWKTKKQSFYFNIDIEKNSLIMSSFNVSIDEEEEARNIAETEVS